MPVDRQRYYDRVVQSLRSAVADGRMGLDDVPELIKKVLQEQMWRSRRVVQTDEVARFERFVDFVRAKPLEGLGAEIKTLQRLCADHRDALDMLDRAVQIKPGRRKDGVRVSIILCKWSSPLNFTFDEGDDDDQDDD